MIDNIITSMSAMLVYLIFWGANLVASLVLNLVVIGEDWSKDKFIKSLWKLFGMTLTIVLLTVGLSLASTETVTIETLVAIVYAAAFTRLAEAITKVKEMFNYKDESTEAVVDGDVYVEN